MIWWISTHAEACTNPTAYLQEIDCSNNIILVVEKGNLHRLPYSFHCCKVDNAINLVLKQTTNVWLQNVVCFLRNANHTSAEAICSMVPEGTYIPHAATAIWHSDCTHISLHSKFTAVVTKIITVTGMILLTIFILAPTATTVQKLWCCISNRGHATTVQKLWYCISNRGHATTVQKLWYCISNRGHATTVQKLWYCNSNRGHATTVQKLWYCISNRGHAPTDTTVQKLWYCISNRGHAPTATTVQKLWYCISNKGHTPTVQKLW